MRIGRQQSQPGTVRRATSCRQAVRADSRPQEIGLTPEWCAVDFHIDAYQRSHPPALVDDTPSPAAAKNLARARRYALALPAATEQPHHAATSFRVSGKIFATVPPDACSLNLFVDDVMREQMVATWPDAFENLLWGGKVAGLRADLQRADPVTLERLLLSAWQRKAPRRLLLERDAPATVATRRARPGKKSADCA